jgi:hypothetical protein
MEEYAMTRSSAFLTGALLALLLVTPVYAEQPATESDPHHPAAAAGTPATPAPAPTPDTGAGMPLMDMCRHMAGMPMMGGSEAPDQKKRAAMLEMRGEVMKAMGDIMMKHARRMGN